MKSTYERLEQMEKRINQDGFTQPKGIGSDIPHFVLDYPAKDELPSACLCKKYVETHAP